jgi:sulfofructose kinase
MAAPVKATALPAIHRNQEVPVSSDDTIARSMYSPVDVVGLGLNAMDTICVVDRFPAPNTKTAIRTVRVEPGGQVATALATCAKLGLNTRYIGSVGNDDLGRSQLASLRESGLDTNLVRIVDDATTQFAVILLEEGVGERTILWHHDPRLNYPPEQLDRDVIVSGRLLHLDGCDTAAALQAAQWAKSAGIPVVIDVDQLYDPSTEDLLRHVDYLIAAEDFVESLLGRVPPEQAVRTLASRYGCRVVGVTLGAAGAIFIEDGQLVHSPAFKVSVADTTGAGDVFHGAFIYGLLQGWNLPRIARFSNAAAALKCTQIGARRGIPGLNQILSIAGD